MKLLICLFLTTIFFSCARTEKNESAFSQSEIVADTIVYTVNVLPTDSTDEWETMRLKGLNRKKLVDAIFESVYQHKATVTDYFDGHQYSLDDVKEMEINDNFDREKIAQLQFYEQWQYDKSGIVFSKKVYKILVAYEQRDEDGVLQGYRAGFVIKTNN